MSGEIPERVTCEVCGTAFDPSESRGWCPNEACGRWQHPAFPLPDDAAAEADGGVNAPTKVCPNCGKNVRVDANFCKFCSHEFEDEPVDEPDHGRSKPGLDQCPDCGADLSSIPPDRLDDCPICGTNLADVLAEQTEPTVTPADLTACPSCGEDLTDIPSDMRMVCPGCRVDLREAIEKHDIRSPDDVSPASSAGSGVEDRPTEATADVDTLKGIGSSYAERLTDVGVETVGDLVAADTGELAAMTDISGSRIDEWKERAPVDPADLGDGGADGAQGRNEGGATGGGSPGRPAQQGGSQQGGSQQGGSQQSGPPAGQQGGPQGTPQGGRPGGQQGTRQGGQGGSQQGGQGARGSGGGGGRRGQGAGAGQGNQQGGRGGSHAGGTAGRGGASTGGGAGRGGGGGQPGGPGYGRAGRDAQPNYDTVVLEVMGQDIRAQPGDTVGREIRTAMVEGGAPDEDAVYVHREHVKVEREGGSFYLERLGQNSLKVNGDPVGQHDRTEIENGDVVSFSEVVTADVRLE
jgi:predicted flap endonuclease-1-like 5' DNA nuclease